MSFVIWAQILNRSPLSGIRWVVSVTWKWSNTREQLRLLLLNKMNSQPSAVWVKFTRDTEHKSAELQFFSVRPVSSAELYLFQRWQDDEVQGGQSLTFHPLLSEKHRSPLRGDRNQRRLLILDLSMDSMKRCEAVCQEFSVVCLWC